MRPAVTPVLGRARATTASVQSRFATIIRAVRADRWVNGLGVYENRDAVLASLDRIASEATAAAEDLRNAEWPDRFDYEREVA